MLFIVPRNAEHFTCANVSLVKYVKLLIIQFRLINIPAIFQKRINSILGEYLNKFIITYLDNNIIYSNSKKEYY